MDDNQKQWQGSERRTNVRLRLIIDDLQSGVHGNRVAVEALTLRVSGLAMDVEALKEAVQIHNKPDVQSLR